MADGWYSRALRNPALSDAGSHLGPVTVGVLHTTESSGFTPRPRDYFGHTSYPHFTVEVEQLASGKRVFKVYQHISIRRSAKALKNRGGGVATNREGCIQIEVVGSATKPFTNDEVMVDGLAELMRWIESETKIRPTSSVAWVAYPASYGERAKQRLTGAQWVSYNGWLGHQHVPENDHGDPGAIDIKKLMPATPAPTVQEDDKMYAVISDPRTGGDYGTDGVHKFPFPSQTAKASWAQAFDAKRVTLTAEAFDAIPTVVSK